MQNQKFHTTLMKVILLLSFSVLSVVLYAQRVTISGYIEDSDTGEELIGANIFDGLTLSGTATNYYGFYSLSLKPGLVEIHYQYVGYPVRVIKMNLQRDTTINVKLTPSIDLDEVVVEAKSIDLVETSQMSVTDIPLRDIKNLPVLMGETDVLKVVQLMPGVQSGSEGTSGLYVRGGGPDQNLFLLDGVPVYNASHLFGFFSIFNADAIKNVTLYKGGFPARFGGRLSSVVDIRMKEGNNSELRGEVSVGLISTKLTLEGPLFSDKTTFIVSGRRTYIDWLIRPIMNIGNEKGVKYKVGYYFYDVNAKATHTFNDNHKILFSFYNGEDKMYDSYSAITREDSTAYEQLDQNETGWGNTIASFKWNQKFGNKLFGNATITYSNYDYFIENEYLNKSTKFDPQGKVDTVIKDYSFYNYNSGIRDIAARYELEYKPHPSHSLMFGGAFVNHTFSPGASSQINEFSETGVKQDSTVGNSNIIANEVNMFAEDDIKISDRLKVDLGAHFSAFMLHSKTYRYIEPRISARYKAGKKLSLKASYTEMNQYIHLLSTSKIEMPTDLWLPATEKVKPQSSKQFAAGAAYNFSNKIDVSTEIFYKEMYNLIEYKNGAGYIGSNSWEDLVEAGKGWSKGIEVLIQKSLGRTTGWIGYTLSKTDRQFGETISGGEKFAYRYDRRHDISITFHRKVRDNFDFGLTWVYGTGNAITLPKQKYLPLTLALEEGFNINSESNYYNSSYIDDYSKRNNYRMPPYHRLDLGFNYHKDTKLGHRIWSVSIYNAYSRQNPQMVYFGNNYYYNDGVSGGERRQLVQRSLFPIIPTVKYSLSFSVKKKKIDDVD